MNTKEAIIEKLNDLGVTRVSIQHDETALEQIKLAILEEIEPAESYLFFIRIMAYLTSAVTVITVFLNVFKPSLGIDLNKASLMVLWTISNTWIFKRYQTLTYRAKEKVFLIELLKKAQAV